jgi:hypothetical protein
MEKVMSPWMTERLNTLRNENQPERVALHIPAPRPEPARRPERQPDPKRGVIIVDLTIS